MFWAEASLDWAKKEMEPPDVADDQLLADLSTIRMGESCRAISAVEAMSEVVGISRESLTTNDQRVPCFNQWTKFSIIRKEQQRTLN